MDNVNVRYATKSMFQAYLTLIPLQGDVSSDLTFGQLKALCQQGIDCFDTYPIDKLSRWLGFIQCALIIHNITSIQTERDFSRPIFHQAYLFDGIDIHKSVDVTK